MNKFIIGLLFGLYSIVSMANSEAVISRIDENTIYVDGEITRNTPMNLYREYKKNKYVSVLIRSEGGSLDSAFDIVDFLNHNKIAIGVYDYCNSACSVMFFGINKQRRFILDDSTLGLHNGTFSLRKAMYSKNEVLDLTEDMAKSSTRVALLYVKAGIPVEVVEEAMKKFGDNSVIITSDDINYLKLGTVIK